jgi:hypothetical protein
MNMNMNMKTNVNMIMSVNTNQWKQKMIAEGGKERSFRYLVEDGAVYPHATVGHDDILNERGRKGD